jgi:DNA-directed RNA polymerase specialized sigma24 family protein
MNTSLSSAEAREEHFIRLYETVFPAVARYVRRKGGNSDAARDIFQDALIVYYEKAVAGETAIHTNEKAYIFGIARHFWAKKYSADAKTVTGSGIPSAADEPETHPSVERLARYLETAGKKCMQLLQSFYYDRLNMQEIAGRFGFSGERSATVQKHKCIEKLRAEVKQKALTYSDFYE